MSTTAQRGWWIVWVAVAGLIALPLGGGTALADPDGQPGTWDLSFNQPGTGLNGSANPVALQADGKILVGGSFTTYNGATAPYLIRLNPDGTRDGTFIQTGTGFSGTVNALAVQPDGKILVGGNFGSYNGISVHYLVRLNADGSRDENFAQTGNGLNGGVTELAVQPDGKVLVGGAFTAYDATLTVSKRVRLNSDGTRDLTFDTSGALNGTVLAIVLQPDGKILAGGTFTTYGATSVYRLIRFNTDGTRDATFTQTGTGLNGTVNALALQPDGKILVGGNFTTYDVTNVYRLVRLNSGGTRDATFAQTGTGLGGYVSTLALQPDGKVLVGGGFDTYGGTFVYHLIRLNTDGTRDATFAQTGTGLGSDVLELALQPDGKIIVGGLFTQYNGASAPAVARLFGVPQPALSAAPATVPYGNQPVNTTSASQTVTITNTGTAPLIFGADAITVAGANAGQFDIAGGTCADSSVAASATCTISVVFAPTSAGAKTGRLSIVSNAGTSPDHAALTGTGTTSGMSAGPGALTFGEQAATTASAPQTVTITSTGAAPLVFGPDAVTIAGTDSGQFRLSGDTCSASTVAGACTVSVSFNPTSAGAKTARINLVSNSLSSPDRLTISGTGTDAPAPAPTPTVTVIEKPAPEPAVTVTATPSPVPPGKPSDLSATATAKLVSADWASPIGATSYTFKVTGTDPKKKAVVKTGTTQTSATKVKAKLKAKSKVTVCVRAVNSAGASAQTCTTTKVK